MIYSHLKNCITDATIKVKERAAIPLSEKNICVQGLKNHSVTVFLSAYLRSLSILLVHILHYLLVGNKECFNSTT